MINVLNPDPNELNFRQRWASYLTIGVAILALIAGIAERSQITNATLRFENKQSGIAVRYPDTWLIDQGQTDYVIRVVDPAAMPFKTVMQIALLPIGSGARSALDVLNPLSISRAAALPAFRTLGNAPVTLSNGTQATRLTYTYTYTEANPALQTVPITVLAEDVVILRSSQAIIVTYESDASSFDENHHYFDVFLRTLEF